jgi:hypothetical protein
MTQSSDAIVPLGAMRFNSDSQKLEYWMGSAWMQIQTFSPNIAESGDAGAGVRAIVGGGGGPSGLPDEVQFFNMATGGTGGDYGDLPQRQYLTAGTSSRTRGVFMGGYTNSPSSTYINSIQSVEIAQLGYTSDFGDLTQVAGYTGAVGNQTRAIRVGGTGPSNPGTNTMDFVTIAVKSDAVDFGDLSGSCTNSNNINSPTRGIVQTNESGTPNRTQLITIPTTGNAETFGELQKQRLDGAGMSNSTRGIFIGGSPLPVPFMEYVTISTTGNGTRFGDLTTDTFREGGHASPVRGVVSGGMVPASPYATLDTLQSINFATEGDTVDFGDLAKGRYEHASISNGHGGLG